MSQPPARLAEALSFLERHRSTVLVTVDLGFNNLRPCLPRGRVDGQIDEGCVDQSLATIKQQLAEILNRLRAAGPPDMDIVGISHYDPLLADYLRRGAPRTFALQSLDVISRLNDTLRSTYMDAGVPMADVAAAFDLPDRGAAVSGLGNVPEDVARTCTLTWMCNPPPLGPNPHPDDAGYEAIARAASAVLPSG
jgi:GDSL-like Lipase/Acylhydrolase family